ncbi:MAG: outer rane channel protein [Mucilaginibacter sp.]|nr:outer rane channel protein [Mucilaginibacter sp.]
MRFSKYILTFLLITGSILAYAQTDTSTLLTLQKCLDIAVKNNLQVKQSGLTAESAHIDLYQAKENLLPSIYGNAGRTLSQGHYISSVTGSYVNQSQTTDNYSLTGGMTLFNGFALQNAIKAASLAFQAGKMDFQSAKDVVIVNVITGYLAILDNEELLAANISQLAVAQQNVDLLSIKEREGANKAASDLTDFKGTLASSQVAVVGAQNSLDAAKLNVFQLMNIQYKPGTEFAALNAEDLSGDYGADPNQIYETALQQFAAVKAATLRRQSAEKSVKSAKGYLFPQLTLNGGLSTTYSSSAQKSTFTDSTTNAVPGLFITTPVTPANPTGKQSVYSTQANYATQNISYGDQFKNNYGNYVGIGLYIPIFTNRIKYNAVSKAKLNLLANQNIEDNTKIVLKQNIEQAYYNMTAAYKRYQALKDQVAAYTESYRIYKLRFDAGVITSVDFIFAKNNLDAATVNMISAHYDYFIDSKILDYYQGKLSF